MCFLYCYAVNLHAANKVTIYTEQWPPYNYFDANNNLVGLATKNVHDILQRTDLEYDIKLMAWVRAYDSVLKNPNGLVYSIFRSEQRENKFHWFCPLTRSMKIGLFKLSNRNDIQISDLQSAKQYRVGIVRGDYANQFLQENGFEVGKNLMVSSDDDANVKLLLRGRIDLTVQNGDSLFYRLTNMQLNTSTVTQVLESIDGKSQHNCLALNKNASPEVVNKIRTAFDHHLKTRQQKAQTQASY